MNLADAFDLVVSAIGDADVAVALRPADLAPPCCYVRTYRYADAAGPLTDGTAATLAVHYVPPRGLDDQLADAATLDRLMAALSPVTADQVTFQDSTVTIGDVSWPCYRADAICY